MKWNNLQEEPPKKGGYYFLISPWGKTVDYFDGQKFIKNSWDRSKTFWLDMEGESPLKETEKLIEQLERISGKKVILKESDNPDIEFGGTGVFPDKKNSVITEEDPLMYYFNELEKLYSSIKKAYRVEKDETKKEKLLKVKELVDECSTDVLHIINNTQRKPGGFSY